MYTPVYGNSALHRHSKDTLLPLRQGKGSNLVWSWPLHPNSNISYAFTEKDGLNRKRGHAIIGFNHGLPCYVKNMAVGPQSRQKPRPTASVFVYLSPSCHVFNIAWQAMIKTYNNSPQCMFSTIRINLRSVHCWWTLPAPGKPTSQTWRPWGPPVWRPLEPRPGSRPLGCWGARIGTNRPTEETNNRR